MLQACSRGVFRCFKTFERSFDAITSTIGPFFVVLCTALLSLGVVTYCAQCFSAEVEVYFHAIFLSGPNQSWFSTILGTLWSVYLVVSFAFHYYHAVTILPGSPHDPPNTIRTRPFFTFQSRSRGSVSSSLRDVQARRALDTSNTAQERRICKKCPAIDINGRLPPKPERAHHCSVCKTCWLKFDHHCPWINGCVGLHNERYFLLFMLHTCLACTSLVFLGFQTMLTSLHFHENWNYWTPRAFTMLLWVLSVAMGFALGIMSLWQLWLIADGESTVEAHDNEYYRKLCKQRNTQFSNPYDLGRMENLHEFFNVGRGRHPYWTILAPVRIPSASDGFSWRKRHNWQQSSVTVADELTDDEGSGAE